MASPAPRGFAAGPLPVPRVRENLFFNFGFRFPIHRRFFGPRFHHGFFGHSVFFGGGPLFCDPFFFLCWDRFFFDPFAGATLPPAILYGIASYGVPSAHTAESESIWNNAPPEEDRLSAGSGQSQATLLQIKDGPMYGLSDYWVEGDRLRYITDYGTANSVSLDSIDLAETIRLNSERGVTFVLRERGTPKKDSSESPAPPDP